MTYEQILIFSIIAATMAMFLWGRLRYDLVAMMALLLSVLLGLVPTEKAFEGFGHAAVITVAAVLIISRALQNSGMVDRLVKLLSPTLTTTTRHVAAGSALGAVLSCFMNNVGALALMLPVTMRSALKIGRSPSVLLIPLSFASLLGGLVTLIGTPPNIIIASFRQQASGTPFQMFDFAPVGLIIATVGLIYLTTIGWRLLPERVLGIEEEGRFHVGFYLLETSVPEGSPLDGIQVRDLEMRCENEISVLAISRQGKHILAPRGIAKIHAGDILVLQGDPAQIQPLADGVNLTVLGQKADSEITVSNDVVIVEAVVMPNSSIEGLVMRGLRMHERYGINLLALARSSGPPTARLKNTRFRTGDVLLLQGESQAISNALKTMGCLTLADRGLQTTGSTTKITVSIAIFAGAICAAALGFVTVPVAFTCAVVLLVLTSTISLNEMYESIEWPVIVLLGALIPIGEALQHTGGTDLIAQMIIHLSTEIPTWGLIALFVAASMWMSDLIHNTPTAVLMAPVALSVAASLGVNADPFLMAVAVGAASPYLTPIGHQSNTLVLGPGGYRFTDYARVGAPLQLLILVVGVPAIIWAWPLN